MKHFFPRAALVLVATFLVLRPCAAAVPVAVGTASAKPRQPQASVDEAGTVHVVYGDGDDVLYRQSVDGGQSFSKPTMLPKLGVLSLGMRRGPRIAATAKVVCVTAVAGVQGKGRDGDVWCCRSTDGGKTWASPTRVNDEANSAREGLHAMATGGDRLCCAWLDLRHQRTEVMCSTSDDGGQTWSQNSLVYRSPDGSVCQCCHPSVAFGPRGEIQLLWRNALAGNRDMYFTTSHDGGRTFREATKLGDGSWPLEACPMDGGGIACLSDGSIVTAWRREKKLYLDDASALPEQLLGEGEQPWIAASPVGPYIVWLARRDGAAFWRGPTPGSALRLAEIANDPVVAASASGNGPVVAFWEGRDAHDQPAILCEVLATNR